MELSEATVGLHLGNEVVDKGEEIVLTLAHQHTDFSVGERVLDKRCSEAWVILHIQYKSLSLKVQGLYISLQ